MNKSKTLALLLSMSMLFSACGGAKTDNKAEDAKEETKVEEATGEKTGEGTAAGNNGDVKAVVTFDGDKISKIDLTHEETEGLGDKAADKLVEEIIANNSVNVDTVSGATVTSTAVIEAVKAAIEASGRDVKAFGTEGEKQEEKETEDKGEATEKDTDVVVIGGGGAGFAAAVTAKEKGADVILLEKLASVGGNTLISGGEYAAPANELQEKEGIEDSKELFAKDVEEAGGDPELIEVLADKATDGAHWLRDDIGVQWLDSLMFFGGHSVKRSYIPKAHSGNELIKNYSKKAEELGIEVITEADVKEILSKDGKVCGVKAETNDGELVVNAKSVVVASGGFGANADMCYEQTHQELQVMVSQCQKNLVQIL